jgi:FAD/FMN-containing dehydrogenase
MTAVTDYEERKNRLSEQMRQADDVRLEKNTSNLFRVREKTSHRMLSVRDFNHVLAVNIQEGWAEVEGMTTYGDFVEATLPHGAMPAIVPELTSITVGGGVSGTALESTSFRYGFVHETVLEMDILLPDGSVVTCTPDNEHRDLFFGIPNSYGTLGYILKLKLKIIPIKPYVRLEHLKFPDAAALFAAMGAYAEKPGVDFIDGAIHGKKFYIMTVGTFSDTAPYTSDYTYKKIYYRSQQERDEDYLTTKDYLWRWDTDWFWCSEVIHAQNPIIRRLLGRKHLNSVFYGDVMRWNQRWHITDTLSPLFGIRNEWVIQDSEIPLPNAAAYLEFFHREISEKPIACAPVRCPTPQNRFPLFPLKPMAFYINIGFYGSVPTKKEYGEGHFNKLVEKKTSEMGGIKMLYSDAYYTEDEFWNIYDKQAYDALKQKYDPQRKLKNLFQKCVKRQ